MRILFCVLDGVSGRPGEIGKKTVLEAAKKPNMNKLMKNAKAGIIEVVKGIAPESDTAVVSLLGNNPFVYHSRRGVLEAIGIGIKPEENALALRVNFSSSSNGRKISERRIFDLTRKEALELTKAIKKIKTKDAQFKLNPTIAYRGVLLVKSKKKLSDHITNTDPAYEIKNKISHALAKYKKRIRKCRPLKKEAKYTAKIINEFSKEVYNVLKDHPVNKKRIKEGKLPANILLLRDAGIKIPKLINISNKYHKKSAIIADFPLEVGIGKVMGMDVIPIPLSDYSKKGYNLRTKKALSALKKYDFIYLHIKGPDLYAHMGDPKGKKKCIEDIDKYFFSPLLKKIDLEETIIVVTADHTTPCSLKTHSSDPVPLMISNPLLKSDDIKEFGERDCKKGSLHFQGPKLMPYLMSLL